MAKVDFVGAIIEGTATSKVPGSIGLNPVTKALFMSTGLEWTALDKLVDPALFPREFVPVTLLGSVSVAETIVAQLLIPANALKVNDTIMVTHSSGKGVSLGNLNLKLRVGALGTVADTSIWSVTLASTLTSQGYKTDLKLRTAVGLQKMGSGIDSWSFNGGHASGAPLEVAVPNMSLNATYLTLTAQVVATDDYTIHDFYVRRI